ncbi:MAG: acyl-CoA oxidase [Gemmatimonadales bacterium]|nr:MAG: acyl-CoA oxidase [Gemmatimonadales bacterium]
MPYLPMIYVAWADGALSLEEITEIRSRLAASGGIPADSWVILESWLHPEHPPTSVELAELRDRIRELASELPDAERRSLASLGAAMARRRSAEGSRWESASSLRTLEAVEELLGVLGGEATRALLAPEASPAPPSPPEIPEPSFPVETLRTYLAGPHAEIRARVLALITRHEFVVPVGASTRERREHVLERLQDLADAGLGRVAQPETFGGEGNVPGSIALFETLALGDLSLLVKYGVQFGLFGGSVQQLGTEVHHERWLSSIGSLDLPGCYAMTEMDHGSNVRELQTRVRYLPDEDQFEVHTPHRRARKDWIGNAALHGRMATVFGQLEVDGEEHGVHAFMVPIRDDEGALLPGITIEDCGEKIGLHGVDNGRLSFDRVRIPRDHLLDRFGTVTEEGRYESPINSPGRRFFTMLGTLVTGRISIGAAAISASKTALSIALRYSSQRRQFGPSGEDEVPILDYLTQQRLLLPRLAECYALHFTTQALIDDYGASTDDEALRSRVEVEAAALKALASRHAVDTIQSSREACGGRGYLAENRFGELRDDTDVFTTFEGANVVLLQLVARGLLSRYREEMGDLSLRGMVRVLADRAGTEVHRRNPVRSRRSAEDHLRDPETHLDAMQFREQRLLQSVARRLKSRIDDGMDSFHAMNECQDHLVSLARAHAERRVLEEFRRAVEAAPDPEVTGVLTRLMELWALSRLEEDRAWFLETGYMEGSQSRAIRSLVNQLCGELKDDAVALTEGFGIPPELLRAPAARLPDDRD